MSAIENYQRFLDSVWIFLERVWYDFFFTTAQAYLKKI